MYTFFFFSSNSPAVFTIREYEVSNAAFVVVEYLLLVVLVFGVGDVNLNMSNLTNHSILNLTINFP